MGPAAVSTVRVAGRRTAASRRTGLGPRPGHPESQRASSPAHRARPPVNSKRSGATPDSPCRPSRCCAGVSDYRSGFEGVPDRMLRSLRIRDASVELRDLALGQMTQARRPKRSAASSRPISASGEAGVLAEPNQHDAPLAPLHVRRTRPSPPTRPMARPARSSRRSPPKRASASTRPHLAAAPPPGQRGRPSSRDGRRSTQLPPAAVLDGMAAPHPIARTPYVLISAERLPPGPSAAPLYPLTREQA